jgi:hypothetical protein
MSQVMTAIETDPDCVDCKVRIELTRRNVVGVCDKKVISDIVESINNVRFGSVEVKIQDSKVVQIDVLDKRRLS